MTVDPLHLAARRVLLDALEDLAEHRDAVIVVGAQAVYLRTRVELSGVAEYTTDGDLALASDRLANSPLLEDAMRARFSHAGRAGAEEPGVWTQTVEIDGDQIEVAVDLIVPAGVAPPGGTRGARLGVHGKRAARKAAGLEAATIDNDFLLIGALDQDDHRTVDARVAGPTALLIAKAHKINDRLAEDARPDRLKEKDASDVYRIFLTTPPGRVAEVMSSLLDDERVAGPAQRGIEMLRAQFGVRRAPGVELAVRSLRVAVPEDRIRAVCTGFIDALGA
ncbi:MAG: hypothetical protein HYX32_00695 [Actinobacteria bacterium]|nr:hypothetical protein [Actinomycetota bacterium]